MRGFIGLCLLITGLSIGAYSHYPGSAHRQASLVELTEIVTGAIHKPSQLGTISRSAHAAELKSRKAHRTKRNAPPAARAPFQRRGWFANSKILAAVETDAQRTASHPKLISSPTRIATHKKPKLRALSIQEPPKLVRSGTTQPALSGGWRTAVVRVDVAPRDIGQRPSSLKPKSTAERWQLIKLIQSELKRVGCYWGRVDGIWGKGSKWAMADFMRAANAALPTKDPDYIQLQLISSHKSKVCGRNDDGSQIAMRRHPGVLQRNWRTRVARASESTSVTSPYRIATGALPSKPDATAARQPRRAPLPGRMAIGVLQGPPELVTRPTRAVQNAQMPSRPTVNQRRLKVSALAKPNTQIDLEGQQVRTNNLDVNEARREPSPSRQVSPFIEAERSAAKARRAQALRKASVRKKRRRHYRKRYRRRSLQTMFMHPLGRR